MDMRLDEPRHTFSRPPGMHLMRHRHRSVCWTILFQNKAMRGRARAADNNDVTSLSIVLAVTVLRRASLVGLPCTQHGREDTAHDNRGHSWPLIVMCGDWRRWVFFLYDSSGVLTLFLG